MRKALRSLNDPGDSEHGLGHSVRTVVAGVAGFGVLAAATLPVSAAGSFGPAPAVSQNARVMVAAAARAGGVIRDLGRRPASMPITASLVLQYNHDAELSALVDQQGDKSSPLFRHYLSSSQFDAYFAPTPSQQAQVVAALQAAGLHVTQSFPNRTVIDVAGPSGAAERFFATEIHSVAQAHYGVRFANVTQATLPRTLATLVRSVNLTNLVVASSRPLMAASSLRAIPLPSRVPVAGNPAVRRTAVVPGRFRIVPAGSTPASATTVAIAPITRSVATTTRATTNAAANNIVKDASFESGAFRSGWSKCQSSTVSASAQINRTDPEIGSYAGFSGSTGTAEPTGFAGVCQLVTVPTSGILSADLAQTSTESAPTYAAQDVFLLNTQGFIAGIAAQTVNNKNGYVTQSWNLSQFAGQQVYIYFGVHGDGAASLTTKQYVDNVSLATGTPSAGTPLVVQNTVTANCTGMPENGPLTQVDSDGRTGYLATSIAKAFDFPVQHGCDGSGKTAAVVIDGVIPQSDVDSYMSASGVKQTGTLVNIPVDGGSTEISGEGELDAETIVGLAPASTVNVYVVPSLTTQIESDAYNRIVSDDTAVAVNSSFGSCEMDDPSGDMQQDAIYVQGAALGISFIGTTGDTGSNECNHGPNGGLSEGVSSGNSPHAVAVGSVGFVENSSGVLQSIIATNPGQGNDFSGGGVSTVYPVPRYQAGIPNVVTSGRNQPDLSFPGVDVTVYDHGQSVTSGGTSWSGPEFVALLTTGAQLRGKRGFGFANPAIYSLFRSAGYTDFYDAADGNNGAYTSVAGFDQVTGIGVPKGTTFMKAL